MRKLLLRILLVIFLTACASVPPRNLDNICDLFHERRDWYHAAQDAEKRWGASVPVSMAILYQESGFRARARPARTRILWVFPGPRPSSAYGYAQALDPTWSDYQEQTGRWWADRDDFSDAIDFVGWYNQKSVKRNGIAPNDAYRLYLAYHEGHGGYQRATYRNKQWLLHVSERVKVRAMNYATQYRSCEEQLGKSWVRRLF